MADTSSARAGGARSLGITTRALAILTALMGAMACGGGEDPPPPPPPPGTGVAAPTGAPGTAPVPANPGQAVAPPPTAPTPTPTPSAGASNFGTIALTPGFMPDPHVSQGTSGGPVNANTLNPACRGYVSQTPDHLFVAGGTFNMLRVAVNGGTNDTTLVIRKPDGTYLCDDDGDQQGGRNPRVQAMFPAGTYQVFIGSYLQGQNYPYKIGLSERVDFTAAQLPAPAGGAPGAAPAAAVPTGGAPSTASIGPGFMPDPQVLTGTAGGAMAASDMNPACRGHVTPTPNHMITTTAAIPALRVLVSAQEDTTLVVRTPQGQFLCNDDAPGENRNPVVSGSFPPGTYQVWVGSYMPNQAITYRLALTERPSLTTSGF